jgi:glucokinase
MEKVFVGIDLGGTNIKFGCFDGNIKLISKTSTPTGANMGPVGVIDKMAETIKKLLTDAGLSLEQVKAAGIGSPGPAIPGFKDVPICRLLSEKLGKPTVLENDASVACWGEYVVGAGKGVKDMVFFTLGTGIGGGIICNGELVHGCGGNASELGHIIIYPGGRVCSCGQKGCVEAYASASATAKRATEAVEGGKKSTLKEVLEKKSEITCKDVFEHSIAGDKLAKQITEDTAKALAIVCVNMLHTTEPQRIVFAGGMIAAGEPLLNRIKYFFHKFIWSLKEEPTEICFAALGEDAGIIGAAALARHTYP